MSGSIDEPSEIGSRGTEDVRVTYPSEEAREAVILRWGRSRAQTTPFALAGFEGAHLTSARSEVILTDIGLVVPARSV